MIRLIRDFREDEGSDIGDGCGENWECISGICIDGVCSECEKLPTYGPYTPEQENQCGPGMTCKKSSQNEAWTCVSGAKPVGGICATNLDCASGICVDGICSQCNKPSSPPTVADLLTCHGNGQCKQDFLTQAWVCSTSDGECSEHAEIDRDSIAIETKNQIDEYVEWINYGALGGHYCQDPRTIADDVQSNAGTRFTACCDALSAGLTTQNESECFQRVSDEILSEFRAQLREQCDTRKLKYYCLQAEQDTVIPLLDEFIKHQDGESSLLCDELRDMFESTFDVLYEVFDEKFSFGILVCDLISIELNRAKNAMRAYLDENCPI